MHIHSNPMVSQMQGLNGTQGAQQAAAARREAMAVRKKLTDFAAVTDDNEGVSRITYDSNGESESGSRRNRDPQSEEESFKSIYFSLKV
jgi:hypothetical protein